MADKVYTGLQIPNLTSEQARNADSGFLRLFFRSGQIHVTDAAGVETQLTGTPYSVTENDVTQYEGSLSITQSQISDLPALVSYNPSTTSINKTLVVGEFCTVTASAVTLTLPSSPSSGDSVYISIGNFTDTVVSRNGSNIMGLSEDLTIVVAYAGLTFIYSGNATQGWRII